jgi:hypothetical protein
MDRSIKKRNQSSDLIGAPADISEQDYFGGL